MLTLEGLLSSSFGMVAVLTHAVGIVRFRSVSAFRYVLSVLLLRDSLGLVS